MMMSSRPTFGGHEKFAFRQGWLKKGVDIALRDPTIFSREEAFVELGVGKNMSTAIRYWGLATGFLQEDNEVRHGCVKPTTLGQALLGENGWDPYLEDIGTLWLIHWQLASNKGRGLVWYLAFSRYYDIEFRKEQLIEFLKKQFAQMNLQTTPNMIEREVEVFLRTYTPAQTRQGVSPEESLDCPLVDLNLLHYSDKVYRFDIGRKVSLPAEIFGYTLLEFLKHLADSRRTASVNECLYQPGSPGQIFKLDENSMLDYLEALEALTDGALRWREIAGQWQVYLLDITPETGWNLLRDYYG
jgi:hypothetical protein